MKAGTSYRRLQRAIVRDDRRGIEARWLYGRALIADPRKMSAAGKSLRDGAIETLIADARAIGSSLSRREIQYRIQCARAYPTVAQLRTAACAFEDWTALREAGFPALGPSTQVPDPEAELDALEATDSQEHEQLSMFPDIVRGVPLTQATMRDVEAYAAEMRAMTASFARRDEERAEHLAKLRAVVGDDPAVLYVDAVAALREQTASL
ncbi:MAG: hypothetical protein ACRDMZ_14180 [Solirubrobacteraceae bacterium]